MVVNSSLQEEGALSCLRQLHLEDRSFAFAIVSSADANRKSAVSSRRQGWEVPETFARAPYLIHCNRNWQWSSSRSKSLTQEAS